MTGFLSAVLAALVFVVGGAAFVTGTSSPAAADPVEKCTATTGAVVVVDFRPWKGKVVRGCGVELTTGYDLLHAAGFSTAGTKKDGPAFVCRLGHGTNDAGKQYPTPEQEPCVVTPQATGYWSYWHASQGQQKWTYSQWGAMARKPQPGDVEAWVFGGTDIGGTKGQPSFTPDEVRAKGGGTTPPDPADPPAPTVPPGAVDPAKAVTWLKSRLTDGERVVEEGATDPNPWFTTEIALALAAVDAKSADLAKVTAFLVKNADGYAYPAGKDQAPETNAAARLALLATATGGDPRAFAGHDLAGDLVKHLCTAGPDSGTPTPGCSARGDFPNAGYSDGQALGVLAVRRAGLTPPADAVKRLLDVQCDNGGFTSVLILPGQNCEPEPWTTGQVVLALHAVGGQDQALAKARSYLKKTQLRDGGFPAGTGMTEGSPFSTVVAAQALRALGDTAYADAALAWVSRQQLTDGGLGFDGGTTSEIYPTVHAVFAARGTSLETLPEKAAPPVVVPPVDPPAGEGPDLKKGVGYLTAPANLVRGAYYAADPVSGRADFGLTIDGAYALAATGLDNAKLRGIVDFLDRGGKDAAGRTVHDWTAVGTKYAGGGSIGKTALLAQSVGRDPRAFGGQDLIAALGKAVCAGPSKAPDAGCAAKGAYSYAPSVFSQSLGIMAQLRAGEKAAAREPIAYLASLQHASGAWPSLVPATGDSDVDSTAMAAMALDLVGDAPSKSAVNKALGWIAGQQLADGGFPGAAGNSVNSAALAVQGLSLDAPKYAAQIAKARKFLAGQQNADGGFNVAKEGQKGSDLRASTQAVGGTTGISFARLERDLTGTKPQPPGQTNGGTSTGTSAGPTGGVTTGGTASTGGTGGTDSTGGDSAGTATGGIVTPGEASGETGGIVDTSAGTDTGSPGAADAGTGTTTGTTTTGTTAATTTGGIVTAGALAGTGTTGGPLASTGAQITGVAAAAALLVAVGWAVTATARRRRTAAIGAPSADPAPAASTLTGGDQ
ncbi:prenyltransferase/squalene oxidase repeat-containing protein [Streptomyces sp. NPDC087440]|uniref:prenyltransferase/squalene oxidase repeat-containing protein n=1 Tax=Streptomyces sp. NPDC087440 TaxID=3365790 RepID=UPI0038270A1B